MHRTKYDPKRMLPLARKLGRDGVCVTEAAQRLGVSVATFKRYERDFPAFRRAASQIRLNSEKWAELRYARLLLMTEEQLLKALAHVRSRKDKTLQAYAARFGTNAQL